MAPPRYNRQALPVYAEQMPSVGRIARRPKHSFQLRTRPWQIQPFLFAPVVPGETLKNLTMQSRCVSEPIRNSEVGWWKEHFFFYVKHRDLLTDNELAGESAYRNYLINMVLDPTLAPPATEGAIAAYYHNGLGPNWLLHAYRSIVYHYFRDKDEAVAILYGATHPYIASVMGGSGVASGLDSLWLDDTIPQTDLPETGTISDVDRAYMVWEYLRQQGQTQMRYEDFLKSYGVSVSAAAESVDKPELIRYSREWSYPTNTVEPTTGIPSAAMSWSIQLRADKDRFFKEPGWIVGVTVARPKVYYQNQTGAIGNFMTNVFHWLPAVAQQDYQLSLHNFANGAGPVPGIADTDGYWIDFRDTYVYGDQFFNFTLTGDHSIVALPSSSGAKRYPALTDAQALFVDNAGGGTKQFLREDGVVQLHILGRQADMT